MKAVGLALMLTATATAADVDLAAEARQILRRYCYECHGTKRQESDPNLSVADHRYLTAGDLIVAGQPGDSRLLARIEAGEMPPDDRPAPTADEIATLRSWIAAGAPAWGRDRRRRIGPRYVSAAIGQDVFAAGRDAARDHRYFSLVNLHDAGATTEEIDTARRAVSKALNSLSLAPEPVEPTTLDRLGVVLRIRLGDYSWTAAEWDALRRAYPYGGDPRILRGDWFVATALRPPLYYQLLGIPADERTFERGLGVDVVRNLREGVAQRAAINDSQVSSFDRIAERHPTRHGSYWKTYNRREAWNSAADPMTTEYDYAESMFSLPNGYLGWVIFIKGGQLVPTAPLDVAVDRTAASGSPAIVAGVSCIACHALGVQPNLRTIVSGPDTVYAAQTDIDRLLAGDKRRFLAVAGRQAEPVGPTAKRYQRPVDLRTAAIEIGASPSTLGRLVASDETLRSLGLRPLTIERTIPRATWHGMTDGTSPAARAQQLLEAGR